MTDWPVGVVTLASFSAVTMTVKSLKGVLVSSEPFSFLSTFSTPTFWALPARGFSQTTYVVALNASAGRARCSTSTLTLALPFFSGSTFTLPTADGIFSVVFSVHVCSCIMPEQLPNASAPTSAPPTPQRFRPRPFICAPPPVTNAGAPLAFDKQKRPRNRHQVERRGLSIYGWRRRATRYTAPVRA